MTTRRRQLWVFMVTSWAFAVAMNAQTDSVAQLDCEFTLISTERLSDLAFVQIKPKARSKVRPVAADFDIIPLRVNSQGRSDRYRYAAPGPIRFVKTSGSTGSLKVDKVLGTWAGPTWKDRSIVVLLPEPDETLVVHAFDDGLTAHSARQVRMLNLAGVPIAGVLGSSAFNLNAEITMSLARSASGRTKVGVSYERFGKPVVAFDQSVNVGENERLLLVFLPPFRPGADVRTRLVRDQIRVVTNEQ
jgi:hypothetical protein